MPLTFITHNGIQYPEHEAIGGASVWIRPLAQHYCKGIGLDIGYSKEKWMLPGAIGIEPDIDHTYHAMHLPKGEFDYLHSSHCLEHVKENWPNVVDYWLSKIKVGGILFLYLPHKSQSYWNVTSNRKHVHEFKPSMFRKYLRSLGHKVWVSGCDFNHSFVVVCEKCDGDVIDGTKLSAIGLRWFKQQYDELVNKYPDDINGTGPKVADFMRRRWDLLEQAAKI